MPQPTQQQVHVDFALTNLSEMYRLQTTDSVADSVFPGVAVQNKSNVFYKYDRGDFFRDTMKEVAPGALPEFDGYGMATGNYFCKEYKLGHIIPDSIADNMDAALQDPVTSGTSFLVNKAFLQREGSWCSTYFGSGLWGTDITGVASAPSGGQTVQWNQSTTATPVEDVLTGKAVIKQATGLEPNVLVLQYLVKKALLTSGEVLDRLKYGTTDRSIVTVEDSDLAKLFKVEKIITAGMVKTTSAEGQATTTDFIAGKNALLAYAAPAPGLMTVSAGYTFNWTRPQGNGAGWTMKQWYDQDRSSRKMLLEMNYGFGLVSNILGYFFSGIVA